MTCAKCAQEYRIAPSLAVGRKYCSKACYLADRGTCTLACQQCGTTFQAKKSKSGAFYKAKFCSRACTYESQRKPIVLDKNGYVVIKQDGKWAFKHRVVMEAKLGRKLHSHETVHHRDGDRANFDETNLELWSSKHGKGQRVTDKIDAAISLLSQYNIPVEHYSVSDRLSGMLAVT